MTLPPRDYIATRRKQLKQHIQLLNEELRQLDAMESALAGQRTIFDTPLDEAQAIGPPTDVPKRRRFEGGGIKGMVLYCLAQQFNPIIALQILHEIRERFGVSIERTSLSPQLSRLKDDELVALQDGMWRITDKGREELEKLQAQQN